MPLYSERYEGEMDDLRFEYAQQEADDENERLRREAGCSDECPQDCTCVEDMIDDERERRAMETDYWASRGVGR